MHGDLAKEKLEIKSVIMAMDRASEQLPRNTRHW